MDKDHTGEFVLGSEEALSGRAIYEDQAHSRRIEKLSLKVTLISVLVPVAIGIFMAFLYMDMRDKMSRIESSGSLEMSKFEEQLTQKLEALDTENADFQKSMDVKLTERLAAMDKTLAAVNARVDRNEKTLGQLETLKTGSSALAADIRSLKTETLALRKDLTGVSSQNAKISGMLADMQKKSLDQASFKTSLDSLKQEISKLKADNIDKGDLATELKKQKVFYQLEIQELSSRIDKKIQALKTDSPK